MRRNTSFILSVRSFDSFDVMMRVFQLLRRPSALPVILAVIAVLAAACGGGPAVESARDLPADDSPPAATVATAAPTTDTRSSDPVTYDFPTGEPVLVAAGYTHPTDRVDNTGAYLPTNGKPTLVFVDAIW